MNILPQFVDMKKSPADLAEDKIEASVPGAYPQNLYPYGLCLCLDSESLEKLSLSSDVKVGDQVHFQCIGKVTSASSRETDQGAENRVEIQITHLSLGDSHEEEAPKPRKVDLGKMYDTNE